MNSNKETVDISDLIADFLSGDECNARELLCWFLNRAMKEEAAKQAESLEKEFDPRLTSIAMDTNHAHSRQRMESLF